MSNPVDEIELHKQIFSVQTKLKSLLDPSVWDYAFLFNLENPQKIELKVTNLELEKLLTEFNSLCNELFKLNGIPIQKGKDTFATFNLVLHAYYTLRYLESKMLYADYEYFRISTPTEAKILVASKQNPYEEEEDISFSIYFKDMIVRDSLGEIDIKSTVSKEFDKHFFKSYCSYFPLIKFLSPNFLEVFKEETSKKIPILLFKGAFLKIFDRVLESFLRTITLEVYEYIEKGYSIEQAKENVFEYMKNTIQKQGNILYPAYQTTEEEIRKTINDELSKNPSILPESIKVYITEILEFFIELFINKQIMPQNIYEVSYREANPTNPLEGSYDYICDLYALSSSGRYPEFAIESYALDLTPKSKMDMFFYITEGIENPNFPLEIILKNI